MTKMTEFKAMIYFASKMRFYSYYRQWYLDKQLDHARMLNREILKPFALLVTPYAFSFEL